MQMGPEDAGENIRQYGTQLDSADDIMYWIVFCAIAKGESYTFIPEIGSQ